MVNPIRDFVSLLLAGGLWLDREEAAQLGAAAGETISVWSAVSARHGWLIAKLACALLWIVQRHHCRDQLINVPMKPRNYAMAFVLLVLIFFPVTIYGEVRRAVRWFWGMSWL